MSDELKRVISKNLITLTDYSTDEIRTVLKSAHKFKNDDKTAHCNLIKNKNIALIFELPSLRTRSAFSLATKGLGGIAEYYSTNDIHCESLPDIARVISKYFDLIIYRTNLHQNIEMMAKYSDIPVINAMSPVCHPVQGLTDILTIQSCFKGRDKIKIINFGDNRSNVSNSLLICAVKMGYDYVAVAPEDFLPDYKLICEMNKLAEQTGSQISMTDDMNSNLLSESDVVYTDAWTLVGRTETENRERYKKLELYRVTGEVIHRVSKKDSIYMHCLPAAHNSEHPLEVTDDVFESMASVVFEQAVNKLYVAKALITLLLDRFILKE